ncbi:uncharacterized protein MELLADRAFT_61957 [Melampsora larici-populina 98AG31]|uniref:Uncharacterized protein n=1 Tax=Melampsora larici-populina (strain 98AG31 / pathotype 3-4-7) TaxID=747676 RepID=F4RHE7_MELLP|nr:uncharacterized protein MELLADRAFT_61957 [Melampsora larici-populina 98AG31]EGG08367.1 hypothetical protein MELLADRAFT_61957 [Melampsora larici-populina 98AG31]
MSNRGSHDEGQEAEAYFRDTNDMEVLVKTPTIEGTIATKPSKTQDLTPTSNQNSPVDVSVVTEDTELTGSEDLEVKEQDVGTQTKCPALVKPNDDVCDEANHNVSDFDDLVLEIGGELAGMNSKLNLIEKQIRLNASQALKPQQHVEGNSNLLLGQAIKDIHVLQSRYEQLEVEMIDLNQEVYSAHHQIKIQERVIRKLMGPHNDDLMEQYDDDSDDAKPDQTVQPQTDS